MTACRKHELLSELSIKEDFESELIGTVLWPSSYLLVSLLEDDSESIQGKRVIELGCGCGIGGIAASKLGASDVVCTDASEHALAMAKKNIQINCHEGERISTKTYIWGDEESTLGLNPPFDYVIGSDILYNEFGADKLPKALAMLVGKLAAAKKEILSEYKWTVLLVNQRRNPSVEERFMEQIEALFSGCIIEKKILTKEDEMKLLGKEESKLQVNENEFEDYLKGSVFHVLRIRN
ncbi:putative protein N-lysine methyltransferase METTL21A [Monocercomonoides exilis]|uniref:putative protein N-lysine methyltransferase METTL21A n=1 Tax=Monocercomonoides exilis TaxID=2049356 RepID=UPI003559DFCA|nr:putative protein N-lysine methyltransferase METTL21A [Monocercomonoides exilis]